MMMLKLAVLSLTLTLAALVSGAEVAKHPQVISKILDLKDEPVVPPVGYTQLHGLRGANHSLILGQRRYGDNLIHVDVAKKSSKIFRVVETDVYFPSSYRQKNNKTINFIQVLDRKANNHGGWPYLTQGGIGSKNLTIHFKSERSHGFDFLIYIYGYNN